MRPRLGGTRPRIASGIAPPCDGSPRRTDRQRRSIPSRGSRRACSHSSEDVLPRLETGTYTIPPSQLPRKCAAEDRLTEDSLLHDIQSPNPIGGPSCSVSDDRSVGTGPSVRVLWKSSAWAGVVLPVRRRPSRFLKPRLHGDGFLQRHPPCGRWRNAVSRY